MAYRNCNHGSILALCMCHYNNLFIFKPMPETRQGAVFMLSVLYCLLRSSGYMLAHAPYTHALTYTHTPTHTHTHTIYIYMHVYKCMQLFCRYTCCSRLYA